MKKLYLGIIGLFLIVIMASGCTDNGNSTVNNTKASITDQIETDNTPVVTQAGDGSGTMIGGLVKNNGPTDVKNVQLMIIGLDINGKKISQKKTLIAHIKVDDDESYDVTLPEDHRIVAGDVKVLNATAV